MPEQYDDFMRKIIGDALMKPFRFIMIDKPESEWNEEDLAYFHRQTCGYYQALGAYGYSSYYMGQVDGEYRYQIRQRNEVIADVAAPQFQLTVKDLVEKRREEENEERRVQIEAKQIEQMFEQCAAVMRLRKKQCINADYLAEEVSDRFPIFDTNTSIVLPDWIVESARKWLSKQEWFIPDADGGFWTN